MADRRRRIPKSIKIALTEQAGGKCANPGCANPRLHIHHIKHWSVYKRHDADDMIAVCPSCHDAIHHGKMEISDDVQYCWKRIVRDGKKRRGHFYIEPSSNPCTLLTGSIAIETRQSELIIFSLRNKNQLSFRVLNDEIMLISATVRGREGSELLRVTENHITVQNDDDLSFEQRAGGFIITAPASSKYIDTYIVSQVRIEEPKFCDNGKIVLAELSVISPNVVRVRGVWADDDQAMVVTDDALYFCFRGMDQPKLLIGSGPSSILDVDGVIDEALFGFQGRPLLRVQHPST